MSHLESSIERTACERATELMGVTNSKLVTPGDSGYPDRIFWLPPGRPVLIEFKRVGEDARKNQEFVHNMLRDLKYEVYVCDNVMDALHIIRNALIERGIECEWNGV
jgi:intracellular sulfur oxidation DsrE/DsrF family protein